MDTTRATHQNEAAAPAFRRARMLNLVQCRTVKNIMSKFWKACSFQNALYCTGAHSWFLLLLQMALQPGVGLGLLYNMPPGLSIPCSVPSFVYTHLSQVHGHIIQPSHFWSSSSSCCIQLSVQHLFWDCSVLHSFYMTKPSYPLAFNKPDSVLPLDYGF